MADSELNGSDLDMSLDEASWIKDHPVYCPISWCTAHTLAHARCGDKDGNYEGLHIARLRYAEGQPARDVAEIARAAAMGLSDPVGAVAFARLLQQSVDLGMSKGKRGRRRLFPRVS